MQDVAVKSLRVALYARVSTEEQKDGQTIDSQIGELDHFARDRGWPITDVYKDDGWSGGLLARPELDRLRDDASKNKFEAVLINDVDRLARDVSHLGIVKRDFERRGIQLIFKKLPNEVSPTHNLMVNILGSFAEFERELILDRTRRGRRHKVEVRQEYIGTIAPYGYHYTPKNNGKEGYLEIAPEEASIVRQMFEWVDKDGLSARKVTARLSSLKIRPRKGGDAWGSSSVIRILRTETYAGVWHYYKFEGCEPIKPSKEKKYRRSAKGSLRRRPKSEWIPVVLPEKLRIVDRDQWQRVQEQLDRNKAFSPRNSKHNYLLSGLVECGGCGARYCGDPNHGRFYYRCYARCKRFSSVREEILDDIVWKAITEAVLNPSLIADQWARREKAKTKLQQNRQGRLQELETARAEIKREESRVIEAYRQRILSAEQLAQELDQIKARRDALDVRMATLKQEEEDVPFRVTRETIFESCKRVAEVIESFTREERQRFLRLLIDRVVFEGSKIRIKGILPLSQSGEPNDSLETKDSRDRIASMELHYNGRNSVSSDGIASMEVNRHSHNSVAGNFAGDWIATMESYSSAHNPVKIRFEVSRQFPQTMTIYEQIDLEWVKTRVREHPLVTLRELSQLISKQFGVAPSISHLQRIQKQAGISRIPGGRAKLVARLQASFGSSSTAAK